MRDVGTKSKWSETASKTNQEQKFRKFLKPFGSLVRASPKTPKKLTSQKLSLVSY
jgi:hypothetical protein